MILTNPALKEKYPYWYANMEREQEQQRMERKIEEAEWRISQFVDMKMNEIEAKIREIENNVNQTRISIEATLNNKPMNSTNINNEVKRMVYKEVEKAFK